jgi:hypothetical protein
MPKRGVARPFVPKVLRHLNLDELQPNEELTLLLLEDIDYARTD